MTFECTWILKGCVHTLHHVELDSQHVDYRKLNAATVTDAFPLPFTDGILDAVAGHEIYCFLDGFSGYNQVRMSPEDQEKTTFVTEWGVFVAVVMMFGLKDSPNYVPEGNLGNIWGIYSGFHASIFR